MQELIIGVVSSLIATALTVGAGWLGVAWPRRLLVKLLSRLLGLGIARSYATQSAANADLGADLRAARWIRVLTGRGNELTRDSFQEVWRNEQRRLEGIRVLLPDPADPGGWLRRREEEMVRTDPGMEGGLLAKQVSATVDYMRTVAAANSKVELRLLDAQHTARVIVTDRLAYFTPYLAGVHGRNSPCLVFSADSAMYDYCLRLFDGLWEVSESVA
ncbi:hypothetical protein ACIBG8_34660 [Nonomuraea sp. NPDC050556]|uniref:hypothetical protein n=1 Tax=Nonomuraea sp. NPDC050556 TaxID=3364369 RepID=UPI0037A059BE